MAEFSQVSGFLLMNLVALAQPECCDVKTVTGSVDEGLDGVYYLNAVDDVKRMDICKDGCVYIKENVNNKLFCFMDVPIVEASDIVCEEQSSSTVTTTTPTTTSQEQSSSTVTTTTSTTTSQEQSSSTVTTTTPTTTSQIETGILLIGEGSNSVQSYGCTISLPTDFGHFIAGGGAAVYNGKPYIYNSLVNKCYNGSLEPSATWDIKENCFSPLRLSSSWTTLGNFIMVTGGSFGSSKLDQIERYDGTTWTTLSNKLTSPRDGHCSVAISNIEMIVIGGHYGGYLTTVEKYNSDGSMIKTLQSMTTARSSPGCTLYNNELYVAGGWNGGSLTDVEVYDMETDQWRITSNKMNNARYAPAAFVINNRVTVLGGNNAVRSIEYLDENGYWHNSPDSLKKDFKAGVSVQLKCPA